VVYIPLLGMLPTLLGDIKLLSPKTAWKLSQARSRAGTEVLGYVYNAKLLSVQEKTQEIVKNTGYEWYFFGFQLQTYLSSKN
jgi:hypothetical protein